VASLRLPDRLRKNLISLSAASDEAVEELHQRLAKLSPDIVGEEFPERITSTLKKWEPENAKGVVTALIGLCAFRSNFNISVEKATTDVLASLVRPPDRTEKAPEGITLQVEHRDKLRDRLIRFLSLSAFDVSAKALGVLTDHQKAYVSGRILSEIRPVFSDDGTTPAAAVIAHSLKIEFMESGESQEVFIALDAKDLQSMMEILQRAQRKDQALRKLLSAANLPYLEPK
jgi:hypothetical protein